MSLREKILEINHFSGDSECEMCLEKERQFRWGRKLFKDSAGFKNFFSFQFPSLQLINTDLGKVSRSLVGEGGVHDTILIFQQVGS